MSLLRKNNRRREYTERGRTYALRGYRFSLRYILIPFAIIVLVGIAILGGVEDKIDNDKGTATKTPIVSPTVDLQDCTLERHTNEYIFRC